MGLRAMFFLLAGILGKFHYLQKGLAFVLVFVGAKMLLEIVHLDIPVYISFAVIILAIGSSMILSVLYPQEKVVPLILDEENKTDVIQDEEYLKEEEIK
jgi:tellurite resistance protein TerC